MTGYSQQKEKKRDWRLEEDVLSHLLGFILNVKISLRNNSAFKISCSYKLNNCNSVAVLKKCIYLAGPT